MLPRDARRVERFDCRAGSALLVHRLALLERLAGHLRTAYGQVASGEAANVTYTSTLGDLPRSRIAKS